MFPYLFFPDKTVLKECRKKESLLPADSWNHLHSYITKDNRICFFGKKKRKKRVFESHFENIFPK